MRLLVIEDDAILRESLAAKLAEGGFAVEQAADGKEGLWSIRSTSQLSLSAYPKCPGLTLFAPHANREKPIQS